MQTGIVKTLFENAHFKWIDVEGPSPTRLQELAKEYDLHPLFVQDCLDPEHLPKVDRPGDSLFIIVRVYDPTAPADSITVQELTRKIAIFMREDFILSIHRTPLPFLEATAAQWTKTSHSTSAFTFITFLCKEGVLSLEKPLEMAEKELEKLEEDVSSGVHSKTTILKLHEERRKLASLKRLLWHTSTIVQRMPKQQHEEVSLHLHDLRETVENITFFCDGLLDDATSLLNLELSMASKKTNDVIQVLTIFSVFFMPLTFIVGVYGMNFRYMPEIEMKQGYYFVWGIMISVTLAIYRWFHKKGWL